MHPKKKADPVKNRTGRPPRVEPTHEVVAQIVDLIEKGTYPLSASRAVGIPKRTWYQWLAAGESDDADPRLSHLTHAIQKARGRLASRLFATIHSAAVGHEEPLRDKQGNVLFTKNAKGDSVPLMVMVPGEWTAAARMLESLSPDEFLRQSGGSPAGGAGEDAEGPTPFEIVYLTSNRDPKELREIEKRVAERAGRA